MDANEREGESDPNAVFIRVYSCPFAVEILLPTGRSPRPTTILFTPAALKIGKTTNGRE